MLDRDAFMRARKSFATRPVWQDDGSLRLQLTSPINVGEVTAQGYLFRATAFATEPDRAVVLQLECHPATETGGALTRVDWLPFRPHNNKGLGPPEWQFIEQKGSHFHAFELNWRDPPRQMRSGNLPIAIPIEPDPESFADLLKWTAKVFNMPDLEDLPLPPWRPTLI